MEDADISRLRTHLLQRRSELQQAAETSKEAAKPVELDQTSVGRLSRMDAMQAQQMAQEAERRRESELVRIDGALRRIDAGEFGWCYVCGEEIDPRRLDIDATTTRCVRCKQTE